MSDQPTAIDTIDGHLTGKARATWPGAQVWIINGTFILRRPGEPDVQLGANQTEVGRFAEAARALAYLREDARRDRR